jgi:hypothetical protein
MYIEDMIFYCVGLHGNKSIPAPHFFTTKEKSLISSFFTQVSAGNSLTEKQAIVIENIFKSHVLEITRYIGVDVTQYLTSPQYRLGKRYSLTSRSCRMILDDDGIRKIALQFPYDEKLIENIKKIRVSMSEETGIVSKNHVVWDNAKRIWKCRVTEYILSWINQNIVNDNFVIDEEIKNLLEEVRNIEQNVEKYFPIVAFEEGNFKYLNTHKNIPQPKSNHLLEVLFEAKKYGIDTWSEDIDLALQDISIKSFTRSFLKSQNLIKNTTTFSIDGTIVDFPQLEDVIRYNGTILGVIPAGDEYRSLRAFYLEMRNLGYHDDEMCALFRVDNEKGKITNDFIKEHSLNNPISEKIKIFFVSTKMPKPLIKNQIKIGTVITLGSINAHHSLRNFINHHHNVLTYKMKLEKNANL